MQSQIERVQSLLEQPNSQPDEALILLTSLVNKGNTSWSVLHFIGVAYMFKKDLKTALIWLQKSIEAGDDEVITYHLISLCHYSEGEFDKAEKFEKQALKKKNFYIGWMHLGSTYRAQAKIKDALECYKHAVEIEPENTGITYQIAEIYRDNGRIDKALELFESTVNATEDYNIEAYASIAQLLIRRQKFDKAEELLNHILKEKPGSIATKVVLSDLFRRKGNYKRAIDICKQLLEEDPAGRVRLNYAVCLQELGRFNEAESNYMKALEDCPDMYESLSNYLMCIHYNPEQNKRDIFEAHKLWDQYFAPEEQPKRPVPSIRKKEKKLRVGLLSGGFNRHPVGWMITKGLEHLPGKQFELYCYTTDNGYDEITNRISGAATQWRSVVGYNDEVIARMIREDDIDILIELSGHAAGNRLRTVAEEPAPVIVKWVGGLFNTTGLRSVDFLITDQYETPEGEEPFYTERLVRMPDDYICYLPPEYAPDIEHLLPVEQNGYITFGCFNNPSKINKEILVHWANIMTHLPDSRLLLKSKQYDTEGLRKRIIAKMNQAGILKDRIVFKGQSNHQDHLFSYNQVDIALDPWPYSGGLTTCESLWMGVPVVTKPGPTFAGRHSATHLTNAGFPEWVTETWEDYVKKTVELANNTKQLTHLRSSLREQVASSPLCDGERFGAHLAVALREMWNQRVAGYEAGDKEWRNHINVKALSDEEIKGKTDIASAEVVRSGAENQKEKKASITENTVTNQHSEPELSMKSNQQAVLESPAANGISKAGGNHSQTRQDNGKSEVFNIEIQNGVKICTPSDVGLLTPYVLLEQEQWFEPELCFVSEYLKPGMAVLDIGAGFGTYTLPMANLVGHEGKVYAFEPGSLARRHLEMSKFENHFENIEIVSRAITDQTGKTKLTIASTPELNKLDETGTEEISQTTLDAWWKFEDRKNINFIKLDVNGDEAKVLSSAGELLSELSPVILVAIGEGNHKNTASIKEKLMERGYQFYEYIPGLKLLTEHHLEEKVDSYLMNLIALKDDQQKELAEAGWFYDANIKVDEPRQGLWEEVLTQLPWAKSAFPKWKKQSSSLANRDYLKALDHLCLAKQIELNEINDRSHRSKKGKLTLKGVQLLVQLYNSGNTGINVAMTLARGLNILGRRDQAVDIMKNIMETNTLGQEKNVGLPFLLPLPQQDQSHIQTDFTNWLTVRLVEAWLALKNVTTYLSGEQELNLLDMLDGNPESAVTTKKKNILVGKLHQWKINTKIDDPVSLNRWFWNKFKPQSKKVTNKIEMNANKSSQNETPSEVIQVKVDFDTAAIQDPISVKIPKKEVFRLNNIFRDNEYSLPDGFHIKDDGVIIDVGANVGAFALYATQWNKNAAIYCFEPNPQVFPLLKSNTKGYKTIKTNFIALGDRDGELVLYQHPVNTGESTTSHKVKGGKKLKVKVRHAGKILQEAEVQKIDVLKVDTEGAEVAILNGLREFLPYTKIIMLEYHTEDDRRRIDKILDDFHLYSAEIQKFWGIGTVKYINKKLLN